VCVFLVSRVSGFELVRKLLLCWWRKNSRFLTRALRLFGMTKTKNNRVRKVQSEKSGQESAVRKVAFGEIDLEESGYAFFHYNDTVFDSGGAGFLIQQLQGFVDWLVGEAEGAVVHGDHPTRF